MSDRADSGELSRTPPTDVRRQLRREVGFGCPIEGCGTPYLEYHHFDPPWHVEHHHDPARMIALCSKHHAQADAWAPEELREIKANVDSGIVVGRFEWMKRDVLAIAGGNYYYETPNIVVFWDEPVIWFTRDDKGRLLLSFRMLSQANEPRTMMDANDWFITGDPEDVESPPGGKSLLVKYANGDRVSVEFKQWGSPAELAAKHPRPVEALGSELVFPLVSVEVNLRVGGTNFALTPSKSTFGGVTMTGNVMSRCGTGVYIG